MSNAQSGARSCIWDFDWYQNRWPWMTLKGVMAVICVILPNSEALGANYVKVVATNLWFKESSFQRWFMAIFAEIIENERINDRHPLSKAIIMTQWRALGPKRKTVRYSIGYNTISIIQTGSCIWAFEVSIGTKISDPEWPWTCYF